MACAGVQVPLPKMVDLALGTPEVGCVNFNILHAVLHVMINQMEMQGLTVEFRGEDSTRVESLIATAPTGPTLYLTEYKVSPEGKKYLKGKKTQRSTLDETEIKSIRAKSNSKTSIQSKESFKGLPTVVVVEQASSTPKVPKMTITIGQERLFALEKDVALLKKKMCELLEMPNNKAIFDALGTVADKTPVTDMWQALNIAKRLECAERGIEKLSTLIEDAFRGIDLPDDLFGSDDEETSGKICAKGDRAAKGGKARGGGICENEPQGLTYAHGGSGGNISDRGRGSVLAARGSSGGRVSAGGHSKTSASGTDRSQGVTSQGTGLGQSQATAVDRSRVTTSEPSKGSGLERGSTRQSFGSILSKINLRLDTIEDILQEQLEVKIPKGRYPDKARDKQRPAEPLETKKPKSERGLGSDSGSRLESQRQVVKKKSADSPVESVESVVSGRRVTSGKRGERGSDYEGKDIKKRTETKEEKKKRCELKKKAKKDREAGRGSGEIKDEGEDEGDDEEEEKVAGDKRIRAGDEQGYESEEEEMTKVSKSKQGDDEEGEEADEGEDAGKDVGKEDYRKEGRGSEGRTKGSKGKKYSERCIEKRRRKELAAGKKSSTASAGVGDEDEEEEDEAGVNKKRSIEKGSEEAEKDQDDYQEEGSEGDEESREKAHGPAGEDEESREKARGPAGEDEESREKARGPAGEDEEEEEADEETKAKKRDKKRAKAKKEDAEEGKLKRKKSCNGDDETGHGSKIGGPKGSLTSSGRGSITCRSVKEEVNVLKTRLMALEDEIDLLKQALGGRDLDAVLKSLLESQQKFEKVMEEQGGQFSSQKGCLDFDEKLNNLDEAFNNQMNQMQDQLIKIERELNTALEKLNLGDMEPAAEIDACDRPPGLIGINEIYEAVTRLREEVIDLQHQTVLVNQEAEERQQNIDQIIEELEMVKTTKADREDLEDALADKADAAMINRKVSHDQFDTVCDDLSKGIEDAFLKLTQQESIWANALEELQQTLGNKLDKLEFDPLKDFVNNKISKLQQKLKALIALKKEQEAAGTKSKFLRNVNCISCDKDVIMRKENEFPVVPVPESLPGKPSMRPYLTYELDNVRKQKKQLPFSRNMNHLEQALQEEKGRREKPPTGPKLAGDHLCNRYCGGSHTVTTPHQRVTRVGHFLTQWGPEAIPLTEGQIMGKDGQMYKARGLPTTKQERHSAGIQTSATILDSASLTKRPGSATDGSKSMQAEKDDTAKKCIPQKTGSAVPRKSSLLSELDKEGRKSKKSVIIPEERSSRVSGEETVETLDTVMPEGSRGSKASATGSMRSHEQTNTSAQEVDEMAGEEDF